MRKQKDASMGRVSVIFTVANNQDVQLAARKMLPPEEVREVEIEGVVDTASNYLVLPPFVAKQLGVPTAGKAKVRYANRRAATRSIVDQVSVELLGRRGTFRALLEPNRGTALIGAIVLEDLDLLVDCMSQKLRPRDPKGIVAEVE